MMRDQEEPEEVPKKKKKCEARFEFTRVARYDFPSKARGCAY
jgi:hypothetical protein